MISAAATISSIEVASKPLARIAVLRHLEDAPAGLLALAGRPSAALRLYPWYGFSGPARRRRAGWRQRTRLIFKRNSFAAQIIPQSCYPGQPIFGRFRASNDTLRTSTTMQAKYRHALPQTGDELFLTDGGLETTLIFHEGIELPHVRGVSTLLRTPSGRAALRRYFARYVAIARARRPRARARQRDLAVESGLGRGARLRARGARRGQRRGGRLRRGHPRRRGDAGDADRAERRHRAARRRLCAGQLHERRGGRGLPRPAGAGVGGCRRRPGDGDRR